MPVILTRGTGGEVQTGHRRRKVAPPSLSWRSEGKRQSLTGRPDSSGEPRWISSVAISTR
jgi:hypothetical protein